MGAGSESEKCAAVLQRGRTHEAEKPIPLPAGEDPGLGLTAAAGIATGLEILPTESTSDSE